MMSIHWVNNLTIIVAMYTNDDTKNDYHRHHQYEAIVVIMPILGIECTPFVKICNYEYMRGTIWPTLVLEQFAEHGRVVPYK